MRVGLLSDLHLGHGDDDEVLGALESVVDRFNDSFCPDVTVVLGDLIQETDSAERDLERIALVRRTVERVDSPVVYLLGNHDVENLDASTLADALDQDPWGTAGGGSLVYLDSSAPALSGPRGEVGERQRSFLDRELDGTDDALVFVHHPIHYHDLGENYWFDRSPERAFCGDKEEVMDVVEANGGVRCVFNGHLHETAYAEYRGVPHVTVNAFNKELPGAGVTGTFAEVVLDDRLRVRVVEGDGFERTVVLPG